MSSPFLPAAAVFLGLPAHCCYTPHLPLPVTQAALCPPAAAHALTTCFTTTTLPACLPHLPCSLPCLPAYHLPGRVLLPATALPPCSHLLLYHHRLNPMLLCALTTCNAATLDKPPCLWVHCSPFSPARYHSLPPLFAFMWCWHNARSITQHAVAG